MLWRRALLCLPLVLAACAEADAPASEPEPAGMPAAGEGGAGIDPGQAGEAGTEPADPEPAEPVDPEPVEATPPTESAAPTRPRENVDFDTAQSIEVGGNAWLQDVVISGQADYYRFTGEQGAFYEVKTDRHQFAPDVVLSLYDAEQHLMAQNDEGGIWPSDGVDARLVVRLPESGEYFVRVEDPWTPPGFFASSFPLLYYHVSVRELVGDEAGVARVTDTDPVQTSLEVDAQSGYAYVTLLGEFGPEAGVFELAVPSDQGLVAQVLASGAEGNGSTAPGGELRVVDTASHVLAQIDRDLGQSVVAPPVASGSVRVELLGASALGDNPFYAVDIVLVPDNPSEQDDVANGEPSGAEVVALEPGRWRRGVLRLTLPPGDVDHFAFEAQENEYIDVRCEAASGGSGVRALGAEVLDADALVLGDGVETAQDNLQIERVPVQTAGTHFLRLSNDAADDAEPVEPWVRCGVTIGP